MEMSFLPSLYDLLCKCWAEGEVSHDMRDEIFRLPARIKGITLIARTVEKSSPLSIKYKKASLKIGTTTKISCQPFKSRILSTPHTRAMQRTTPSSVHGFHGLDMSIQLGKQRVQFRYLVRLDAHPSSYQILSYRHKMHQPV